MEKNLFASSLTEWAILRILFIVEVNFVLESSRELQMGEIGKLFFKVFFGLGCFQC